MSNCLKRTAEPRTAEPRTADPRTAKARAETRAHTTGSQIPSFIPPALLDTGGRPQLGTSLSGPENDWSCRIEHDPWSQRKPQTAAEWRETLRIFVWEAWPNDPRLLILLAKYWNENTTEFARRRGKNKKGVLNQTLGKLHQQYTKLWKRKNILSESGVYYLPTDKYFWNDFAPPPCN